MEIALTAVIIMVWLGWKLLLIAGGVMLFNQLWDKITK